ncbi:hypothetical protein DMUE_4866 [Dictyocoela muelleri]|nr:hypothetical protein DMUE_4866 [Dictyocoela muelleri]
MVCDGTFKSAPSSFDQLFTIQCYLRNDNLPLIYCFLKNRSEVCYDHFFVSWLSKECNDEILPKNLILHFELASYNSCRKYFKDIHFFGCFFHLGQIIWRRIPVLKFATEFVENSETNFMSECCYLLHLSRNKMY